MRTDKNDASAESPPLILYDGTCGLCHRSVRMILAHEREPLHRFAALQSPLGQAILARHGLPRDDLSSLRLVQDPGGQSERLSDRSTAALEIAATLKAPLRWLAPLRILPRPLRDLGYRLVAALRYRLFGRKDLCDLPSVAERKRFLTTLEDLT